MSVVLEVMKDFDHSLTGLDINIVFWQALESGDEKMAQKINLPLAQKMVEKMEKEGKMEQEQETILYLMILELRSDWEVREWPPRICKVRINN